MPGQGEGAGDAPDRRADAAEPVEVELDFDIDLATDAEAALPMELPVWSAEVDRVEARDALLGRAARLETPLLDPPSTDFYEPDTLDSLPVLPFGLSPSIAPAVSLPPEPGDRFGNFVLVGQRMAGGMAEIRLAYRAGARGFSRPCVIKRIRARLRENAEACSLFREEARISSCLDHPNIVRLLECGEVDGRPYLAMELVDGIDLAGLPALTGGARLPLSVVLEIGRCVAAALAYAHELTDELGRPIRLVHRDVSPENVLLSRSGEVKLADFGIARFEGRTHQTSFGPPRGKLPYMAPEQLLYLDLDHRADLFGLGILLAELVSGASVLPGGSLAVEDLPAVIRRACGRAAEPLPHALVALLVAMTAFDREQRIGRAAEVVGWLEAILGGLSSRETLADFALRAVAPHTASAEEAVLAAVHAAESAEEGGPIESWPVGSELGPAVSAPPGAFLTTGSYLVPPELRRRTTGQKE